MFSEFVTDVVAAALTTVITADTMTDPGEIVTVTALDVTPAALARTAAMLAFAESSKSDTAPLRVKLTATVGDASSESAAGDASSVSAAGGGGKGGGEGGGEGGGGV